MNIFESIIKFLKSLAESTATPVLDDNPFSVKDGLLYKDGVQVRFEKTAKMSSYAMQGPKFVVQHYTANNTLNGTINVFKNYSASSHLIVDRDGTAVQMVPFDRVAWHAGKSYIESDGVAYKSLNKYSIGIEFVNFGYLGTHVKNTNSSTWPKRSHKNETGKFRKWQPYTDVQLEVAEQINAALMDEYKIPASNIVGHDDISPNRKVDPGPMFPLEKIKSRLGDRK